MTRRFCATLIALLATGLFFADSSDANARHRRGGSDGGYGSNGGGGSYGGNGSWGGNGSAGGRGGLFSRHRRGNNCECYANHGSNGGYGSNGGHGSNGGYGSNGGHYSRPAPTEYRSDYVPDQPPPAPESVENNDRGI